jgi:hypothetical protein
MKPWRRAVHQAQDFCKGRKRSLAVCRESDKFLLERNGPRGPVAAERHTSGARQSLPIMENLQRCGAKRSVAESNEKAVRQLDGLLFQGRIVPTEFKKSHQNFLAKSYWALKGSVKEFLENKCLCFQ